MRIISGKYGGRRFNRRLPSGIRPTLDAVREAVFNILFNMYDFAGLRVADLYAGTGAMGLEALSRGAADCTFVEKNPKTAAFIKGIAVEMGIGKEQFNIINTDAVKFLKNYDQDEYGTHDIVFADPPYKAPEIEELPIYLINSGILIEKGVFVFEYSSEYRIPPPMGMTEYDFKIYGDTAISIYESL
ncbi:MAG: 16S rRNA (guanine(966)-N(2))-methyltransferase RsmD [Candidatus Kapaibacterium sp.]